MLVGFGAYGGRKLFDFHDGLNSAGDSIHFAVLFPEADMEAGMGPQDIQDGILHRHGSSPFREMPEHRDVVLGLGRGLHAVVIHSFLLE